MNENLHINGDLEIDNTNITLEKLITEKGVINSNNMTKFTSGTDMLYQTITFKKAYTKPPTVITATITDRSRTYYGIINTFARGESNKSCDIVMAPAVKDANLSIGYIVISND